MSTPQADARPQVELKFTFAGGGELDAGKALRKFEFKGMVNGGYIVRARLFDPHSALLKRIANQAQFFQQARKEPVYVEFRIKWHPKGEYPKQATRRRLAVVASLEGLGDSPDVTYLEFIAIDPPSWYLNIGGAWGGSFKGSVSQVIKQVVNKYARPIRLDIGQTVDSRENRHWMMRQDPKTFINSILDWSSSVTQQRTHWLVVPEDMRLTIKEQADLPSRPRAYYRYHHGRDHDTIKGWSMLADNALSLSNTKLLTAGASAISGQFLDRVTDRGQERRVYVTDANTAAKKKPAVNALESYSRPPGDEPPGRGVAGWTQISAIPEFSAGDLGVPYERYIDGRPRGMYLNMQGLLFRSRFRVVGHGEWDTCEGLGADTIFVKWMDAQREPYFLSGNWLTYGFHHLVTRKFWWTDLYTCRLDHDAQARAVGGGSE